MQHVFTFFIILLSCQSFSQRNNLVYVDKQGVLRWTKDKSEAAFFGVNYTVPFAYGYRSHKALNVDLEKAIDADVHHMSRLGLDAFRVHVWDVEITDSLGNLIENEHLRLFDYLLSKLREKNIKILLTPIAFWGNGYPERDEKTNGFSSVYGKGNSVVLEAPIKAQENYLRQLVAHVNPYTKLSYRDDPDIIAAEINNEPHHSGPKEKTTEYINRLEAAIRSTGWTKPVYYNISESPSYADAVVKSRAQGYSFQWYPTGLVAGHEQKGNYLPHVDQYFIPFGDTIPQFSKGTKLVYEFDAGDVMQPIMYPAMARSFRTAGFQWATQFAYDPMATAYGNTEYQTHYLNLIYTPAKAISLLIASKVFHKVPRLKSYGNYPADTLFDVFRVSYKEQLSLMNSEEEFYYSNTNKVAPKNITKLKHVAGTGSSAIVDYQGSGAYFLDRTSETSWKLELMPDAVKISDPFEKASPSKAVVEIQWKKHLMKLNLPGLGDDFLVRAVNIGNEYHAKAKASQFEIQPGVYELIHISSGTNNIGNEISQSIFFAPSTSANDLKIVHQAKKEVSANRPFNIVVNVTGNNEPEKLSVELRNSSNKWKTVPLEKRNDDVFVGEVPADMASPGLISYRIYSQGKDRQITTFPGAKKGDPYAWDYVPGESYETFVASPDAPIEIFNANTDRAGLVFYNPNWRNNSTGYTTVDKPGQLVLRMSMKKSAPGQFLAFQNFITSKVEGRREELPSFTKLVIRARSGAAMKIKLNLITNQADAWSATIDLDEKFREIEIPLNSFKKDSYLLLPRPYPGFLPLSFKSYSNKIFDISDVEKLEVSFGQELEQNPLVERIIEIESVRLIKN